MTKDEALQMCLEYIETDAHERKYVRHAIKEALAQPAQEPVGKFAKFTDGVWREVTDGSAGVPLYTTPPQRPWVGLTDDDKKQIAREANYHWEMTAGEYAERIGQLTEAKLRSKNNA